MPTATTLILCGSIVGLTACGSASASSSTAGATPAATARPLRAGTAGQLVQVKENSLILSTTNGDVTVDYSTATRITTTSTGSPADIVAGTCVVVVGQKSVLGGVTATSVRLSQPVSGLCTTGFGLGAAGGGGVPGALPPASPRPTLNPNVALVSGQVTAVSGTTVTVKAASAASTSVTVPTTLTVTEASTATAADLTLDSCVRAAGRKNAAGVVQATSLTIQPTDSSGSCTFAGAGGFGRGGFGGGGFGGVVPGAPTPAA